jgi:hypothetical protein
MVERTLEERVARLEQRLDDLAGGKATSFQVPARDWRRTVGMFRGDPIMKQVIDGALRLREDERQLAREQEVGDQP